MKYLLSILCLLIGLSYSTAQADTSRAKADSPAKIIKETSYAYGYSFASDLISNNNFEEAEKSTTEVLKGLKDGLQPDSARLADIVETLMKRIDSKEAAKTPAMAQETAYKLGYNALGNLVSLLELDEKDLNYGCIKKGYKDFATGKKPKVALEKQTTLLAAFFQEKQALAEEKERARREKQAQENLARATAFLAENAKKSSIKSTVSGLQYQVIKEGTGEQASINSRVSVHYTGTFIDGKVFDSSIERGEPAEFSLAGVIQGWREGIPMMRVGSRYRFFIPPALAYGARGPSAIPPNSLLVFDVELLEVIKEAGPGTAIGKLSYAYGYTVGKAVVELNFSEEETAVEQFVQGFAKGFGADPATVQAIETTIKTRIASSTPSPNKTMAYQIASGIGYTSSAGLVKAAQAKPNDFDYEALAEGYTTGLEQKDPLYNPEDMNKALEAYATSKKNSTQQVPQPTSDQEATLAANLKAGTVFLTENIQKQGVIALPSGLQYQVIKEGTGPQPTISNTVTTHYTGKLIDGTVFDSSVERGKPATFPLRRVIKGWQEGIPLMKQGGKYRLFIPAHLAYGNNAMGSTIPAGSTLIFEVELLNVE